MARARLQFRLLVFVLLLTGTALLSCQDTTSGTDPTLDVGNTSDSSNADTSPASVPDPHYQDPLGDEILNGTCAPEGETFTSVYSCDTVEGPSATEPPGAVSQVTHNPAILEDPDYDWVLGQLSACSCTCCHTGAGIGTYRWSSTFELAWTDSADSDALNGLQSGPPGAAPAAIPPGENNGFSRDSTSHPTTDPERFRAFILRELARRNE
jgi:hypothetical protein